MLCRTDCCHGFLQPGEVFAGIFFFGECSELPDTPTGWLHSASQPESLAQEAATLNTVAKLKAERGRLVVVCSRMGMMAADVILEGQMQDRNCTVGVWHHFERASPHCAVQRAVSAIAVVLLWPLWSPCGKPCSCRICGFVFSTQTVPPTWWPVFRSAGTHLQIVG